MHPSTRKPGRRPKLSQQQRAEIVDAVMSKRCTAAEMARHHEVSEPTVSRILSTYRAGIAAVTDDKALDMAWFKSGSHVKLG